MASVFNKGLSLEFAKLLLEECKSLGISYLPIRWLRFTSSRQHWAKGHLIDVHGKSLLVRPLSNTHKREEVISFTSAREQPSVNLWTSKMSKEQVEMVRKLKIKLAVDRVSKQQRSLVMSATSMVSTIALQSSTEPPVMSIVKSEPAETEQPSQPLVMQQSHVIPSVATHPMRFSDKLASFMSLKEQLQQEAQTEGISFLQSLLADHKGALEMAENIKREMMPVVDMLNQVGVAIPPEIVSLLNLQPPREELPQLSTNGHDTNDKDKVIPDKSSNWCTNIAAELEPQILDYLRQHPDKLLKGKEIMAGIGFTRGSVPSSIMGPLVAKGSVDQYGRFAGCRYRIGELVAAK